MAETDLTTPAGGPGATAARSRPDPAQVEALQAEIDLSDTASVTRFGEHAQRKAASFADQVLSQTRNRELGDTGALLSDVIAKAQGLDPADLARSGPLGRAFGGVRRRLQRFKERFEITSAQIDRITVELERRIDRLRRDVVLLDGLHEQTRLSIQDLDAYIAAGRAHAERYRATTLADLLRRAQASDGDLMASQALNDATQAVDRLEKRVLYLQQARQVAIQQLPQIRIVQNGDTVLIESLQASITLAIPAWKQKMVLLLGLNSQREALALQTTVTDATNEMLRQASGMMKSQALEIERQSQRGLVDVDTLRRTNQDLIETVTGVLAAQAEGREKRAVAERELEQQTEELRRALGQVRRP